MSMLDKRADDLGRHKQRKTKREKVGADITPYRIVWQFVPDEYVPEDLDY